MAFPVLFFNTTAWTKHLTARLDNPSRIEQKSAQKLSQLGA
jgi:hypothetical protein